jgi:hypothetical protein
MPELDKLPAKAVTGLQSHNRPREQLVKSWTQTSTLLSDDLSLKKSWEFMMK